MGQMSARKLQGVRVTFLRPQFAKFSIVVQLMAGDSCELERGRVRDRGLTVLCHLCHY